jgi:hypothetical protein
VQNLLLVFAAGLLNLLGRRQIVCEEGKITDVAIPEGQIVLVYRGGRKRRIDAVVAVQELPDAVGLVYIFAVM